MKLICEENPNHDEFTTTAHVMQEWAVDNNGAFLYVTEDCLQVTQPINSANDIECKICGGKVFIEED